MGRKDDMPHPGGVPGSSRKKNPGVMRVDGRQEVVGDLGPVPSVEALLRRDEEEVLDDEAASWTDSVSVRGVDSARGGRLSGREMRRLRRWAGRSHA